MRARRGRRVQSLWQGFADLAMGLMAVIVLVLVILLWRQGILARTIADEKQRTEEILEEVRRDKEQLEAQRVALEGERGDFAIELIELFETTYDIVLAQDRAEDWLSAVFEQGTCRLRMTARGELVIVSDDGVEGAANLYESGRFALSPDGRAALDTCRENFLRLAYCLAPTDGLAPPGAAERRARYCDDPDDDGDDTIPVLRSGIEALVLEGSTDRIPLGGGTPNIRVQGAGLRFDSVAAGSFVENAYLGAERARQALGNLLSLVEHADGDDWDALQVMLSRVRIESPSFGRFQAGPLDWREPGCDPARADCAAARNLALRIRWQKRALRRPFDLVRVRICELLETADSAFAKGLLNRGRDLAHERARFGCEAGGGGQEEAP